MWIKCTLNRAISFIEIKNQWLFFLIFFTISRSLIISTLLKDTIQGSANTSTILVTDMLQNVFFTISSISFRVAYLYNNSFVSIKSQVANSKRKASDKMYFRCVDFVRNRITTMQANSEKWKIDSILSGWNIFHLFSLRVNVDGILCSVRYK